MRKLFLVLTAFISIVSIQAQDTLYLQSAIDIALQNNNLLKVSRKQQDIIRNDVSLGYAGYYPTINIAAGNNIASNSIRQELVDGRIIIRDGARASNINANANFTWVIFDGFRRSSMYNRLRTTYVQSIAKTNTDIENTIQSVSNAYYELVRQQEIAEAYFNNLNLYLERLRLAEARQQNGVGSKGDILLTRVDINTQRSILLRQQILVENSKVVLNQSLSRDPNTTITLPKYNWQSKIDTSATFSGISNALKVSEQEINIASQTLKETNGDYLPTLSLLAGYNYTRTQSQAGLTLLNRSTGPNIGLSLAWNIFDGFNKNRIRKAGLMRIDVAKFLHEENKISQQAEFKKAMTQFKIAAKILALEEESYTLAVESNELAKQRYLAGSINLFEYKETQLALEASKIRLANARFESLATETELNRLNSNLIK